MSTTAEAPAAVAPLFRTLPVTDITESKSNPRRAMDAHALAELTDSVRKLGVLQPILVRPLPGIVGEVVRYELVAGHRRFAAAKAAELAYIPATVRKLTDIEVLEIQLVENLQRADLHPLEEAEGYRRLTTIAKMDVARIAERVGRSVAYVYDRLKLLALTKEARKLFLEDRFAAGHAILLARLKPEAQARALDPENEALFTREHTLWNPEEEASENNYASRSQRELEDPVKPRSVRELQAWIDQHVRFDPAASDLPDLFPETKATLDRAKEEAEPILQITWEYHVRVEARDGNRVWGPRSWKKAADKPCDHAVTGVIVVGPGRGEAFKVCIAKEKCKVHWASEQREKAKRAKANAAGGSEKEKYERQEAKRRAEEERKKAERARWEKAVPAVLAAFAEQVKITPAGATGPLGQYLIAELLEGRYGRSKPKSEPVPPGTTAEDLVRHLAYSKLEGNSHYYGAEESFPKIGKALGIDVAAIVEAAAPVQTSGNEAKAPKGHRPRKRGTKAKT